MRGREKPENRQSCLSDEIFVHTLLNKLFPLVKRPIIRAFYLLNRKFEALSSKRGERYGAEMTPLKSFHILSVEK